jgi:TRAP-type mannitol/chloroaromatic compound transport system permease small subunit
MRGIVRIIDSICDWNGKISRWLFVVLILVMTYEALMRYAFDAPPIWAFETSMMLGAAIFVMSYSYTHRHNAHIRIDMFYQRLPLRKKAIIDVLGALLLSFPIFIVLTQASFIKAWDSWAIGEVRQPSAWYPPLAPLRTVIFIGFCLLALQSVANFLRDIYMLIRNKNL